MEFESSLYGRWSRFSTIRGAASTLARALESSSYSVASLFVRCLCASLLAFALIACAPVSTLRVESVVRDAPVESAPESATESASESDGAQPSADGVVAYGIDSDTRIEVEDDAWTVAARADSLAPAQAVALLLPAIASSLRAGDLSAAQLLIARAKVKVTRETDRYALQLHRAKLAQLRGHHRRAIALLRDVEAKLIAMGESVAPTPNLTAPDSNLTAPDSTDDTRAAAVAEVLLLLSDSQRALGRNREAARSLMRREALLSPTARIANQRRLLALIDSLDAPAREALRARANDANLLGWIALSEILRLDASARDGELLQWRTRYRRHPALTQLINRDLLDDKSAPSHIALLLPLTSQFGHAAQAFYEGFMASRAQQDTPPPRVSLHDIGDDPSLAALYYRAAVREGAEFVVGPLGRRTVGALLADAPLTLPTLLLGDVPMEQSARGVYGLSLSPEEEARQAAQRAFADGHRRAGVLRGESEWGARVADAFEQQWESLGAQVAARVDFPRGEVDHSAPIRTFLGLDDSVAREKLLSAQLNLNLQFTPRRRDDLDLLFLATDAAQARLIVPQLRFFQAHDLALYATSAVYAGAPNAAVDADLDSVMFGDLRWMIDAAAPVDEPAADADESPPPQATLRYAQFLAPERLAQAAIERAARAEADASPNTQNETNATGAAPATNAKSPRHHYRNHNERGALGRLYALGLDSYHLLPALAALRANPQRRFFGDAADISVQEDGNALRHLDWARFADGIPQPLPPSESETESETETQP